MGDGDLDEAQRILAKLEEHVGGPHVQLRAVKLRAARKDREGAREAFEALVREADTPPFVVSKAAAALAEAGYGADVDEVVAKAVEGNPPAAVARLFVERASGRGDWSFLDRLPALVQKGDGGREILYAAIDALGGPAHRARLHEVLRRFGDAVRETHRGWAKAASALVGAREFAAAATWAADWEARKPDEPWMVHPLAVALRHLGRPQEAARVAAYALDLPAEDTSTDDFRVWLAFEEALNGRTDAADRLLAEVDDEELDDVPRILSAFARTLLQVQRQGRSAFAEARDRGREAIKAFGPKGPDPDVALSSQRWARRLARDAGGLGPWIWAAFLHKRLRGG
jgi:hypothetical protein